MLEAALFVDKLLGKPRMWANSSRMPVPASTVIVPKALYQVEGVFSPSCAGMLDQLSVKQQQCPGVGAAVWPHLAKAFATTAVHPCSQAGAGEVAVEL